MEVSCGSHEWQACTAFAMNGSLQAVSSTGLLAIIDILDTHFHRDETNAIKIVEHLANQAANAFFISRLHLMYGN